MYQLIPFFGIGIIVVCVQDSLHILTPLMQINYYGHLAFMWHLRGIFVYGTYFAVVL